MNSIILRVIIECVLFLVALIVAWVEHRPNNKKEKILFFGAIIIAIATLMSFLLGNDVQTPHIYRKSDHSAIILHTDEPMNIEYRILSSGNSGDEWIKFEKPIKLKENAIIYARASTLWYRSEPVFKDVYVTENGLVYFSGADKPGDTIVELKADYNYKDADLDGKAGNHYIGYELKYDDFSIIGKTIKNEEKEIQDFTFSPKILQAGKNDIKIEYMLADDISVVSHLYVNGDEPSLVKMDAKYTGGKIYLDTVLGKNSFIVQGTYEDGTKKTISDYTISSIELKEGKNEIVITKDGISDIIELMAIDRDKITENESEPNNEIKMANEIEVNVKYSGTLYEDGDVDYYKVRLDKKGKIIISLKHPKMDDSGVFWLASLLSQEENIKLKMESVGNDVEANSSPVRVTPGVYYIKVNSYYYSDEVYTLTVLFEEEDDSFEYEPNDNLISQAMPINLDKEYTGNLTSEDDIDYYKFTTNEKRKIRIDFAHDKTSESNTLWLVALLDDSDGELLKFGSTGESSVITSDSVRLPAGNYYIRVKDNYWSDIDYTFCVCSEQEGEETENEDNDDYATATHIGIGSTIIGNIQSEDDVDFYQFELKEATSVKVSFMHQRIDNGNIFWRYELHSKTNSEALTNNEEKNVIVINGDSAECISSTWNFLPADTYYLKIYKQYYNNADYQIVLSNK